VIATLIWALPTSLSAQTTTSLGNFEGGRDDWVVTSPGNPKAYVFIADVHRGMDSPTLKAKSGNTFLRVMMRGRYRNQKDTFPFLVQRQFSATVGQVLSGSILVGHGRHIFFTGDFDGKLTLRSTSGQAVREIYRSTGHEVCCETQLTTAWTPFEHVIEQDGDYILEAQLDMSPGSGGEIFLLLDDIKLTSPDRVLPIVTPPAPITIDLKHGETELAPTDERLSTFLSGATAADENDGDIPATEVNLPPSFTLGETEVRFEATDQAGNTGFATSKVTIAKGNIPPSAVDDNAQGKSGQAVSIAVTGNDSDEDGDPLTVSISQTPQNGTVTVTAEGTTAYTAEADFVGSDSFTYTISDGRGGTSSATVTITVKSPLEPVVTAPAEIIITVDTGVEQVPASDERIAAFLNGATALDETDGVVPVTAVDAPASFLLGETTVRFQAVDLDGNIGIAYSKVTVKSIPAICKPLPGPNEIDHQPVPGEYAFKIFAEQFLAAEILTQEQFAKLHPKPLWIQIIGDPQWTTWYADDNEYERLGVEPFDPAGIHSVQGAVYVLDNPLAPRMNDTPSFFEEIRYLMTWHHSSDDFVMPAHDIEFTLDIVFNADVTFRVHTLEEGAQGHIVQLLHRDPAREFPSPADQQQYRQSEEFDDVFDDAYYAPSFFKEGFINLSLPFRFLGRKCRSIVEAKLDLDVRGPGLHYRGRLGEGLTAEQEKELVEPRIGELNALGIELVRFIVDRATKLNAGFFVERYVRPVDKTPESTIPQPLFPPIPDKPLQPPVLTPPPIPDLPEKLRTPADIMGDIEKNFQKLPPEKQQALIETLKQLSPEEKEQLSPFFRGLLEKKK